jgi:riboflavin biosynthesis pyrimidine reductase
MITTLDGAVALAGRSGAIGGPADKRLFALLRSLADVVMVGAGTARAEGYGRVRLSPGVQQARVARGQAPLPPLAVVSGTGVGPWTGRLATDEGPQPMIVVPETLTAAELSEAGRVAMVVRAGPGPGRVDLGEALRQFWAMGLRHVVCEGGPGLNATLAAAGLVDELCLTLSPKLAGWAGGPLAGGWLGSAGAGPPTAPRLEQLAEMALVHVAEEEGFLFLRLRVRPPAGPPATSG